METFSSDEIVSRYLTDINIRRAYLESVYRYLVQRKYFKLVRQLLEEKVPPLYDIVLSPPSSISDTLLQMIQHPLRLMSNVRRTDCNAIGSSSPLISDECVTLILSSFVNEILVPEYTKPIRLFVIPCLANNVEFPFSHLLHYLSDLVKKQCVADQQHPTDPMLAHNNDYGTSGTNMILPRQRIRTIDNVFNSSYVFHAILTLNRLHLEHMHGQGHHPIGDYINVLGNLSDNIRKLQQRSSNLLLRQYDMEFEADDDSDTDVEIDRTIQSISMNERDCLTEVIAQLNDEKHVEVILNNIEHHLDDVQVLYSLCKICHNLMLYHRTAVFDFQYVMQINR